MYFWIVIVGCKQTCNTTCLINKQMIIMREKILKIILWLRAVHRYKHKCWKTNKLKTAQQIADKWSIHIKSKQDISLGWTAYVQFSELICSDSEFM